MLRLSFLFLFGSLSMGAFAQQSKIVVKKGEKYQVVSESKTTSVAEAMGQSIESSNNSTTTTVYEVKDVESSEIKLESMITKLKNTVEAMGQTMEFDSDKTDNSGPGAEEMAKSVNKVNAVKLDSKGTVTKQDAPEATMPGAASLVGNSAHIDLFIPELTGVNLKVGATFPESNETKGEKMSSKGSGTYTITAIDNGVATVDYVGTVVVDAMIEQMDQEMNMKGNNSVKTAIKFDVASGRVLSKSSTIDSDMTIEIMGMSLPTKATTTTTVTITKL
jgi:hypothetical protein